MNRYLPVGIALVLMLFVAVVQGYWTDRWGKNDTSEVVRRTECLKHVPYQVGRWEGKDVELKEEELRIATNMMRQPAQDADCWRCGR